MSDKTIQRDFMESMKAIILKLRLKPKEERSQALFEEKNNFAKVVNIFCAKQHKTIEETNLFYESLKIAVELIPNIIASIEKSHRDPIITFLLEVYYLNR